MLLVFIWNYPSIFNSIRLRATLKARQEELTYTLKLTESNLKEEFSIYSLIVQIKVQTASSDSLGNHLSLLKLLTNLILLIT